MGPIVGRTPGLGGTPVFPAMVGGLEFGFGLRWIAAGALAFSLGAGFEAVCFGA